MTIELYEYWSFNKYTINLKSDKKLCCKLIYNLRLVELETFKAYIKTNPVNGLILRFKYSIRAYIQFIRKLVSNFYLCIN